MYYLRCTWLGVDVTHNVTRMGVLCVSDFLTRKQTIRPDVNFYNEQEFFHDAIACFVKVDPAFNIQLFGGLQGHFIPFYGVDAVASGCFEIAGKVVAHSILNGGSGFVGLAPCVREYLATGCVDAAKDLVSLDDLPDLDLKHILGAEVSNIYSLTGTVEPHLTATLFLLPPCYYGHVHFIYFIIFLRKPCL